MPAKTNKHAKQPKQKAQAADALAILSVAGGKRKRVDAQGGARGKRGTTSKKAKLEEIPTFALLTVPDVLYKICSYLHPLAVLYLSRTCKKASELLLSKASIRAWCASFKSVLVEGIHDLYSDMYEPRLASLFFEDRCDGCQKSRRGKCPQFMLRVNMCDNCLYKSKDFLSDKQLKPTALEITDIRSLDYGAHIPVIKSLTPSALSSGFCTQELFDRASFVGMVKETKGLTKNELDKWSKERRYRYLGLEDECKRLKEYMVYMKGCAEQEKVDKRRAIGIQRRKDIAARFKEAGYVTEQPNGEAGEEFWDDVLRTLSRDKISPSYYRTLISRQSPLTEQDWNGGEILKCLIACGKVVKGDKLRGEREENRI
ncbi:hypothetical protein CYLTODRAFT_457540 [Cylindrobasidium torrendii FP15055 ss-10]|uniref:F-box domain-containing protein n=1 Tax=Cylindrobasidium torrendii FP15055 ss-10 TaxID=1314674 RepID=A0A0D7B3F9_9AGAR|nr:hypothetical protein CYLTODRAFT_457540 [Cylindrobasidium torrendii FP15055 ss-10]